MSTTVKETKEEKAARKAREKMPQRTHPWGDFQHQSCGWLNFPLFGVDVGKSPYKVGLLFIFPFFIILQKVSLFPCFCLFFLQNIFVDHYCVNDRRCHGALPLFPYTKRSFLTHSLCFQLISIRSLLSLSL